MQKKMNKKILCCVLSLVLLASATISSYAAFSDTQGHWSEANVDRACEEGIVNGYTDGSFKPNAKVSHQEAMTMVCRTVEAVLPGKLDMDRADNYMSVLTELEFAQSWALPYGAALFDAGAAFVEDFSGKAGAPATRQTIGAWMVRALDLPVAPLCEVDVFPDMDKVDPMFTGEVHTLKHYGIMSGYTDGSFGPANQVTRGEFATVCVNVLDCMAELDERAGTHELDDCLFLRKGTIESLDVKTGMVTFSWGDSYYIPVDTVIIMDGTSVDLRTLAGSSGQEIIVSFLQDQESSLVIQTEPLVESGKVKTVTSEADFWNIGILTGSGHIVNYALPRKSGFTVPAEGAKVSFIAQGVEILEII